MPLVNEVLAGRWNRLLQRVFNIQSETPSPQLASEIVPVFEIARGLIEDRFGSGTRIAGWGGTVDASAVGVASSLRIRNPANSGVLVILEHVQAVDPASASNAFNLGVFLGNNDLAIPSTSFFRDLRADPSITHPAASVTRDNVLGAPGTPNRIGRQDTTAQSPAFVYRGELVLPPGSFAQVWEDDLNTAYSTILYWRERPVLAMELAS